MPLSLLLAPLELLEALHDRAVGQASFLVLHGRNPALLGHLVPPTRLILAVLRRVYGQLIPTPIDCMLVCRAGSVGIGLYRLHDRCTWRNQI